MSNTDWTRLIVSQDETTTLMEPYVQHLPRLRSSYNTGENYRLYIRSNDSVAAIQRPDKARWVKPGQRPTSWTAIIRSSGIDMRQRAFSVQRNHLRPSPPAVQVQSTARGSIRRRSFSGGSEAGSFGYSPIPPRAPANQRAPVGNFLTTTSLQSFFPTLAVLSLLLFTTSPSIHACSLHVAGPLCCFFGLAGVISLGASLCCTFSPPSLSLSPLLQSFSPWKFHTSEYYHHHHGLLVRSTFPFPPCRIATVIAQIHCISLFSVAASFFCRPLRPISPVCCWSKLRARSTVYYQPAELFLLAEPPAIVHLTIRCICLLLQLFEPSQSRFPPCWRSMGAWGVVTA